MSISDYGRAQVYALRGPLGHQTMSRPLPSMQIPSLLLALGITKFIFISSLGKSILFLINLLEYLKANHPVPELQPINTQPYET